MRRSEDARAQPRPPCCAGRTGASAVGEPRRGYGYPVNLCDHGHAYPTAPAYGNGIGTPCPIPSRFSLTVAIATKSPL